MNRPNSVKPDNFFLLLFNALRQRRIPLALRIASHSLLLVVMALLIYTWVMGMQFRQAMQQQADALGQSLTVQTAASATELLVSNDILSLNVLLSNLVRNPLVAHAAIYSVDNRVLAEAGNRPSQALIGETEGLYSTPITFQEVIAGHLRISLDMQQFQQPMTISLQSMGILSLILLALSLSLSLRLGRHLSLPLLQLRVWLRDPDDPAPGAGRQDEIGDLARQLQARLVPPRPEPVAEPDDLEPEDDYPDLEAPAAQDKYEHFAADFDDEPDFAETERPAPAESTEQDFEDDELLELDELEPTLDEQPAPAAEPASAAASNSAVLAIQLGAQDQLRHLPRARLVDLLERYRDCMAQSAALYQGELHTLSDGSSLILFHAQNAPEDYLTHAICCGELMRALGHALQIEVADSGITLQLQLGLSLGDNLSGLGHGELLLSDTVQRALALSQHSRNLLLIERQIGDDSLLRQRSRIRPIASPEGACCVERLLDPYPALLERQLTRMHDARGR
ncbi:putative membrane protein affecting hemolysin expression/class 3 adenylate cyclase [Pseudomonas fluvialis]|uniref:Putative membrane protein affecting hemolysin expression/class 3 adenylate cyclase n=1 Tax=Pseudomonas fluvialis TaxID=1793966 RepID=A0A7X0ESS3_9PSED|nr:AhpA/YtjB family protein [Pseudomonas fluvialis]MBB6340160.1 putative membrane protein affecting hemolysin expression/class 3 adenylate cyclase [Pseudomonas fluvialis]